ncbi:hypothetical protein VIGAN_08266700 [Vigna angularis var. angularis]|uniref:Uncharacterized protein n=1 Tax=Vigna angularis var. angularis TaxID=157739 RepID=A0A0S3SSN4_PHAAN|nr:hypothetical protein VIGAN_08266700 [Vigna angularis var. angularis]
MGPHLILFFLVPCTPNERTPHCLCFPYENTPLPFFSKHTHAADRGEGLDWKTESGSWSLNQLLSWPYLCAFILSRWMLRCCSASSCWCGRALHLLSTVAAGSWLLDVFFQGAAVTPPKLN